ncbi:hypothetical protein GPECTOR_5g18 [Gonium pectorale]|uniref:PDEase domain-containing protein n=1 Tax=Gonium pectorale TaxID=33097 RepID=A0A150GWD0_GONPE|nr:hypothetical protein GPECTOR_5g18 [Gonium pectorale]|eukprot:KXZ54073.1 hypothetical protein GPECTOR_5g18 [Gonium pectorale]
MGRSAQLDSVWPASSDPKTLVCARAQCTVAELFNTLFVAPELQEQLHKQRGDMDMVEHPWVASKEELPQELYSWEPSGTPNEPTDVLRYRKVRFKSPPAALASKPFSNEETQVLTHMVPGQLYVLEAMSSTSAPYGDKFNVFFRYTLRADDASPTGAPASSTLHLVFHVEFLPSMSRMMKPVVSPAVDAGVRGTFRIFRSVLGSLRSVADIKEAELPSGPLPTAVAAEEELVPAAPAAAEPPPAAAAVPGQYPPGPGQPLSGAMPGLLTVLTQQLVVKDQVVLLADLLGAGLRSVTHSDGGAQLLALLLTAWLISVAVAVLRGWQALCTPPAAGAGSRGGFFGLAALLRLLGCWPLRLVDVPDSTMEVLTSLALVAGINIAVIRGSEAAVRYITRNHPGLMAPSQAPKAKPLRAAPAPKQFTPAQLKQLELGQVSTSAKSVTVPPTAAPPPAQLRRPSSVNTTLTVALAADGFAAELMPIVNHVHTDEAPAVAAAPHAPVVSSQPSPEPSAASTANGRGSVSGLPVSTQARSPEGQAAGTAVLAPAPPSGSSFATMFTKEGMDSMAETLRSAFRWDLPKPSESPEVAGTAAAAAAPASVAMTAPDRQPASPTNAMAHKLKARSEAGFQGVGASDGNGGGGASASAASHTNPGGGGYGGGSPHPAHYAVLHSSSARSLGGAIGIAGGPHLAAASGHSLFSARSDSPLLGGGVGGGGSDGSYGDDEDAGWVVEEVFENERFQPFRGWGHMWPGHFLPSDRVGHWSDRQGKPGGSASMVFDQVVPLLPHGWRWVEDEWQIDVEGIEQEAVDADGWTYALDFYLLKYPPPPQGGKCSLKHFVRRRRYFRTRVRAERATLSSVGEEEVYKAWAAKEEEAAAEEAAAETSVAHEGSGHAPQAAADGSSSSSSGPVAKVMSLAEGLLPSASEAAAASSSAGVQPVEQRVPATGGGEEAGEEFELRPSSAPASAGPSRAKAGGAAGAAAGGIPRPHSEAEGLSQLRGAAAPLQGASSDGAVVAAGGGGSGAAAQGPVAATLRLLSGGSEPAPAPAGRGAEATAAVAAPTTAGGGGVREADDEPGRRSGEDFVLSPKTVVTAHDPLGALDEEQQQLSAGGAAAGGASAPEASTESLAGVAGSGSTARSEKVHAQSLALDAAAAYSQQLYTIFGLTQAPPGSLQALEVLPAGVLRLVYPLAGNEALVGFDIFGAHDAALALSVRRSVYNTGMSLSGPFPSLQGGGPVLVVQKSIHLPVAGDNETFGRPDAPNPMCGAPCRYNATTGTKLWGFAAALIQLDAISGRLEGTSSPLRLLEGHGYRYTLTAPSTDAAADGAASFLVAATARAPVTAVEALVELPSTQVGVWGVREVRVLAIRWVLAVGPSGSSWMPHWHGGVVAGVVLAAAAASCAFFSVLLSRSRHQFLLQALLPQEVLADPFLDVGDEGRASESTRQTKSESPADQLMEMLGNLLSGGPPDPRDIALLRTVLQHHMQYNLAHRQPVNIKGRIREANLDAEVARALMRQLGAGHDNGFYSPRRLSSTNGDTAAALHSLATLSCTSSHYSDGASYAASICGGGGGGGGGGGPQRAARNGPHGGGCHSLQGALAFILSSEPHDVLETPPGGQPLWPHATGLGGCHGPAAHSRVGHSRSQPLPLEVAAHHGRMYPGERRTSAEVDADELLAAPTAATVATAAVAAVAAGGGQLNHNHLNHHHHHQQLQHQPHVHQYLHHLPRTAPPPQILPGPPHHPAHQQQHKQGRSRFRSSLGMMLAPPPQAAAAAVPSPAPDGGGGAGHVHTDPGSVISSTGFPSPPVSRCAVHLPAAELATDASDGVESPLGFMGTGPGGGAGAVVGGGGAEEGSAAAACLTESLAAAGGSGAGPGGVRMRERASTGSSLSLRLSRSLISRLRRSGTGTGTQQRGEARGEPEPAACGEGPAGEAAVLLPPLRPMLEEVERLLCLADQWQFDTWALQAASGDHALSCLGFYLIQRAGLVARFRMDPVALARLLRALEAGYLANPYHNATHAADVLACMHALLHGARLTQHYTTPMGLLACYFAAIVHDYGHPGLTGDFLVATSHPLALRYNDRCPLENHHCAAAFILVAERPELDAFAGMTRAERADFRQQVIDLVIATDMKQYVAILNNFTATHRLKTYAAGQSTTSQKPAAGASAGAGAAAGEPSAAGGASKRELSGRPLGPPGGALPEDAPPADPVPLNEAERILSLQVALKCADIGHLGAELERHKRWLGLLEEEFFRQGDRERQLGLPISPLFDRAKQGVSKSQVGFFDFVALPLVHAMAAAFPGAKPLLRCFERNYNHWREVEAAAAAAAAATVPPPTLPTPRQQLLRQQPVEKSAEVAITVSEPLQRPGALAAISPPQLEAGAWLGFPPCLAGFPPRRSETNGAV